MRAVNKLMRTRSRNGRAMKFLIRFLVSAVLIAALAVGGLWLYFGGGVPYKDLTTRPAIEEPGLEMVLAHADPVGGLAVSESGRIFFAVHADSRAEGPRVFEWRDGEARPFPAPGLQAAQFETPAGLAIDRNNRLWVIDPASHGFGRPRIVAIDLDTGLVVHEHVFPRETAPRGSFLHDLQVDPAGRMVYIADAGLWRKAPAVVVYDTLTRESRRRLEGHPALVAEDWLIETPVRTMQYVAGLVSYKPGLHGIGLDPTGRWLYLGAMAHGLLHRVPAAALADDSNSAAELAAQVEQVGAKPLSDGLSADLAGNVYITDVEHGAVLRMDPAGNLQTIVRSPRIRWAQSLSFGPAGWLYVSDSALAETLLKPRSQVADRGPYHVFRFRPGTSGVPGQ
jgi:sugar lactone lactonase YvrE